MYHFFTDKSNINDKFVRIEGKDVNHIKNVLRMRIGEEISVGNGEDDDEYRCEITEITDEYVAAGILFVKEANVELPVKVTLFQGLPKSDKMETIIQKCVELGITEIVPVETKRCVVKIEDKKKESRVARWQAIAEAAGKQSQRSIIPKIGDIMSFREACKKAEESDVRLIPYELSEGTEKTKEIFKSLKPGRSIAVFIGPEGGFEEKEIAFATECGIEPVSLGKRILRTETAGMTVLAWIGYELEIGR